MSGIYHDTTLNRKVFSCEYEGRTFRFPAFLSDDRYEAEKLLCCGGFGALLIARDRRVFNQKVLIKSGLYQPHFLMTPNNQALDREVFENRRRMEFERKMLLHGQLRGVSGIPTLIDWFTDDDPLVHGPHRDPQGNVFYNDNRQLWKDSPYIVISYFNGIQLDDYCKTKRARGNPLGTIRALALYLANTLEIFHKPMDFGSVKLHFVYQDLKPGNVLCSYEGVFQLIDFGSFAAITPRDSTGTGTGTAGYTAPEIATHGKRAATPQVDIYSLGITLKVCLQICKGIDQPQVNADVNGLEIPNDWKEFLNRCTAPDPNQRFRTMLDIINNLPKYSPNARG
jgi:serine/threonine protein kinase